MNAQTAKITPGRWHVVDGGLHWNNPAITNFRIHAASSKEGFDVAWSKDGELVVEHVYEREDAELIAEAGNVAQETGLSPRQLADQLKESQENTERLIDTARQLRNQRAELLEALREARDTLLAYDGHATNPTNVEGWTDQDAYASYMKASAAIQRATGEQP